MLEGRIVPHVPKYIRYTYVNFFAIACLLKNVCFPPYSANRPPRPIISLLFLIQSLDFTFYKMLPVLNTMMTVNYLFLPKTVLLSIYLVLKPLLSKLQTPPSADKKNSCAVERLCTIDALSSVFFQPITSWLFSRHSCYLFLCFPF